MRLTTIILAVFSATAVSAAALSAEKREADALCLFHGQGCWKRDAAPAPSVAAREPEPEAEAEADPLCLFHGQGCWKRDAEPEPKADALCLFHGQGCWKRDAEKREADALCLFHGQGCWKDKRDAEPVAEPLCLFHGQGCWKREAEEKRTADPLCLFHGQGCWKRDAAAAAAPDADPLCLFHGQGCWKDKRDPDPVPEPLADPLCLFYGQGCWKEKREAAPLPAPAADAEADPLCLFHGQGCWKRDAAPKAAPQPSPEALCLFYGQGCWKVKRAAYAFANALRSVSPAPETRAAEISNSVGGAAYNAKRATNEIAQLLAGRTTDPIKYLDNLYLVSLFGPDASINTTADESSYKRSLDNEIDRRLCLFHGQGCWKREAEAQNSEAGSAADKRACNAPGAACDIARRAAEALVTEIESFRAPDKRAEELEVRLCLFHGQGCWKRDTVDDLVTRCHAPGGACDNAARDLKAMHTAARALLKYVNEEA